MPGQLYKCATCGHAIASNAKFCIGCRTPGPLARHPNSWRTAEPQWAIDEMLAAKHQQSSPIVVIANQKSSGLAALLSFFWCRLGQIYNGEIIKGVAMMIVFPVSLYLGWFLAFVGLVATAGLTKSDPVGGAMWMLGTLALLLAGWMWLYGMINAYRRADEINQKQLIRAF